MVRRATCDDNEGVEDFATVVRSRSDGGGGPLRYIVGLASELCLGEASIEMYEGEQASHTLN